MFKQLRSPQTTPTQRMARNNYINRLERELDWVPLDDALAEPAPLNQNRVGRFGHWTLRQTKIS